jgi:uncharacterized protein
MSLASRLTRGRLLALFIGLTFAFGFGPLFVASFAGARGRGIDEALATFRSIAPLLAALIIQGPILSQPVMEPLGLTLRARPSVLLAWIAPLVALAFGIAFAALAYDVPLLLTEDALVDAKRRLLEGDARERFEEALRKGEFSSPLSLITMGMTGGVVLNLIPAFAEEVGFRGFLFREMPGGFWGRSLAIGVVWGAFFAPTAYLVALFPGRELEGALLLFAFCIILSPALTYVRIVTDSTIAVAITRAGFAALTKVGADLTLGLEPVLRPPFGISGLVGATALVALLYLIDRSRPGAHVFEARAPRTSRRR